MTEAPAGVRPEHGHRLTVQGWTVLALSAVAVVTLSAAGLGMDYQVRADRAADRMTGHVAPARAEQLRLEAALLDQRTGVADYLRSGDRQALEPYTRGRADEQRIRDDLARLETGDARLTADLAAVETAADRWRRDFAQPAVSGARRPDAARTAQGQALFDRVSALSASQGARLDLAAAAARAQLADARTQRDWVFGGVLAAFALTCGAFALLLRLAVGRPLLRLTAASRRAADGGFEHPIPQTGAADLQALARAVEAMRLRAVADLAASRRAGEELARQAADLRRQAAEPRRSDGRSDPGPRRPADPAPPAPRRPPGQAAPLRTLLKERYGERLDERASWCLAVAADGAAKTRALLGDLLIGPRGSRPRDVRAPVDLDRALAQAVRNLQGAVQESGAVIDVPGGLPEVVGDPALLTELWQNLLGEAVASRRGDRVPEIRISAEPEPDGLSWRFAVADNGVGAPPEFADTAFPPYQRPPGQGGRPAGGLALSREIVELHGGRLWVDAGHAPGARLCFVLPVRAARVGAARPGGAAPSAAETAPAAEGDAS